LEVSNLIGLLGGVVGLIGGLFSFITLYDTRRVYKLQFAQYNDSKKKEEEEYNAYLGHIIESKNRSGAYFWCPDPIKERESFEALVRLTYKGFMVYNDGGFMLKQAWPSSPP
jgi:hypothetical protein